MACTFANKRTSGQEAEKREGKQRLANEKRLQDQLAAAEENRRAQEENQRAAEEAAEEKEGRRS